MDVSYEVTATLRAQMAGHPPVICLGGNGARPSHRGGGYSEDGRMFTLNTIEKHGVCYGVISKGNGETILSREKHMSLSCGGGQAGQGYPAVCYGISAYASNAMKSSNPHSGIYEAKTSRTLDLNGGNPSCNQGGVVVVQCIEMQNACADTEKSFTLQAGRPDDHHIPDVCYPNITGALCAKMDRGLSGQDGFNDMLQIYRRDGEQMEQRKYVLRRLTPTECARLQGFPDWWCDGADGSDSAMYKMWGNGIALPCAADVIGRLAKELDDHEKP